jgi:hypothetical protein
VSNMEQRNIHQEVQALWLQYFGLEVGSAGNIDGCRNVACIPGTQIKKERMPEITGLILAT